MRPRTCVVRILAALLVLRVFAAPIGLRPGPSTPAVGHRFVIRVCAWPAQRPARPALVGSHGTRFRGPGGDPLARVNPALQARAPRAPGLAPSSALALPVGVSVHLSDCPRC